MYEISHTYINSLKMSVTTVSFKHSINLHVCNEVYQTGLTPGILNEVVSTIGAIQRRMRRLLRVAKRKNKEKVQS
jgi:hypothetical protein